MHKKQQIKDKHGALYSDFIDLKIRKHKLCKIIN